MSTDRHNKDELENTLNSYKIVLDIFKLNNDNYFKRVQVFMSALQVGLAIAFAKVIYAAIPKPLDKFPNSLDKFPELLDKLPESWDRLLAAAIVAVLGHICALFWKRLSKTQSQYLEFNRRYLRNLETRLQNIGVPLDFFTIESNVFRPPHTFDDSKKLYNHSKKTIEYTTACIYTVSQDPLHKRVVCFFNQISQCLKRCWKRVVNYFKGTEKKYAKFNWSEESYPETDGADKLHKIGKVKGGMIRVELKLTRLIATVWLILAVICYALAIWPFNSVKLIISVSLIVIGILIHRWIKF